MKNNEQLVPSSPVRVRFFFGQLLGHLDHQVEQRFHVLLRRLGQREALGTGTVAGLKVVFELDGKSSPRSVFVLPGFAVDPDGRELLLLNATAIEVADDAIAPASAEFSPEPGTKAQLAAAVSARFGRPFSANDLDALVEMLAACGLLSSEQRRDFLESNVIAVVRGHLSNVSSTARPTAPVTLRQWLFDQLVGTTFVGLRFAELSTELQPAMHGDPIAHAGECFASRVQHAVLLVASPVAFPEVTDPFRTFSACFGEPPPDDVQEQLCECILATWRGLPPADLKVDAQFPTVSLARVCWSRFHVCSGPRILAIDNCSDRPLAPGGPVLRGLANLGLTRPIGGGATGATGPAGATGPRGRRDLRGRREPRARRVPGQSARRALRGHLALRAPPA